MRLLFVYGVEILNRPSYNKTRPDLLRVLPVRKRSTLLTCIGLPMSNSTSFDSKIIPDFIEDSVSENERNFYVHYLSWG